MEVTSALSVVSLFSGSKGNCIYISGGGTEVLCDAGMSAAAIRCELRQIGTDLDNIKAIFITHEHSDHIRGLPVIARKYGIPVHMTELSARALSPSSLPGKSLLLHPPVYSVALPRLTVRSFVTPHDSAMCVGYRFEADSGEACAIATDLGRLNRTILDEFLGCRAVILESNHDVGMLMQNPAYPPRLKEKILSDRGHLSNEMCAKCIAYLAENGTECALLAHLSQDNNTPDAALAEVLSRLTVPFRVLAAAPAAVTRLL